jgi:hypothetical protein
VDCNSLAENRGGAVQLLCEATLGLVVFGERQT